MQLLEYQAKQRLAHAGLEVPRGRVVTRADFVESFTFPVVVKSQVPVGGRGKLGGVKLARDEAELRQAVSDILQLEIKGYRPEAVLVEEALAIERELYLALRVNRDLRRVEYVISAAGGVEIESNASSAVVVPVDDPTCHSQITRLLALTTEHTEPLLDSLESAFVDNDCLLLEINPLAVCTPSPDALQGQSLQLVCADAKVTVDDNARFRHPEYTWSDQPPIKPLGGTIGVIANGAGMAMSTMDTIYAAGSRPANFLDIGGGTGEEVFVTNLRQITALPGVTSIIINIFAGITRCDDIARGIIAARQQIPNLPPLFIRLEGTNKSEAAALLAEAGVGMEVDLRSCVQKAIKGAA